MMIRTKLKTVIYLCIMLAAISSITVFYSFRNMEQKLDEKRNIHDMVRGLFDLTILTDEYLLYHEKRPLEQWNRQYNALAGSIEARALKPSHNAYPISLEDDYKDVKTLFSRLIAVMKNPPFQDNVELSHQLRSHLQSQILTKNHELVTRAGRLEEIAEREQLAGQKRMGWLILGIIAAVCISVIGLTLFVRKRIVHPFEKLNEGVKSIGKGNLDVRIDTKAQDEIGELSREFGRMVSRLREVMVSRTSLQEEVTQRKQAEEALRDAALELEQRVEERTAELEKTNRKLTQEIENRGRLNQELEGALVENQALRERLKAENIYLKQEIKLGHTHKNIVGESEAIKGVLEKVEQVAKTDTSVLIQGETGTGKDLVAQAIHNVSLRRDKTMVKVNCAALPPTLIENELFGREKGAYTGAFSRQVGRFEIADGSTIFLDEISELSIELQGKLLRVLQDGRFERLGATDTIKVDVRLIAATNRDLESAIKEGSFREDLFYRLNVFPIYVPPLRDRREDIPSLVWTFIKGFERRMGKSFDTISQRSMELLQSYPWPGNVRELKNLIERMMILCEGEILHIELPGLGAGANVFEGLTLEAMERKHILSVLEQTDWRVSGQKGAAEILGLKPTTLNSRMKKLGITRSVN